MYTIKHSSPIRIISLVPSQTELLFDLGLDEEVIGITKFCVHPQKWFKTKTRIGGTKTVDINKVKALKPDLIIANKEENVKEQVEELATIAQVYTSDIVTLENALEMIFEVGRITGKEEKASEIAGRIQKGFDELESLIHLSSTNFTETQHSSTTRPLKVAYLIWKDPYMAAGGDTFINNMLEGCGFENVLKNITRYPEVDLISPIDTISPLTCSPSKTSLSFLNCDVLLLSSEPYPFKQKHIHELQPLLPNTRIILVDGEMFSWYGSRLMKAAPYFQELITKVYK